MDVQWLQARCEGEGHVGVWSFSYVYWEQESQQRQKKLAKMLGKATTWKRSIAYDSFLSHVWRFLTELVASE